MTASVRRFGRAAPRLGPYVRRAVTDERAERTGRTGRTGRVERTERVE
ncbi:hypothetical protein [Streptomyces sp. NPDC059398]